LVILVATSLGLACPRRAPPAVVGTWALVSATNDKGGQRSDVFGVEPKGLYVFTEDGRFSIINMRKDLPRFASGNRMTGTPEENQAIVKGSIALFGRYRVEGSSLVLAVEGSTWPVWTGTEQPRAFTMSGNEMRWHLASSLGGTTEIVLRRQTTSN